MNRLPRLLVIGMAVSGIGGCQLLAPPSEDPVLMRLEEIERRLVAMERVVQNQSLVDLSQQVSALERRADELAGVTETLDYNAATTSERQRALYNDLDARLQALEQAIRTGGATSVLDGGPLAPGQLPVPGGSDDDNYRAAFELIKEQRYDAAEVAFREFLVAFPGSGNAPNAQYWLAESFYVRSQYDKALAAFRKVIDDFPQSRKVVDALLKIGYCNYELGRWDAARTALAKVQSDYPDTTAARLAGQRLERMQNEGV